MSRLVVVLNHWGGVPRVLHENLTSTQQWKNELYDNVHLSTTNGTDEFISCTRVLWHVLNEQGFYTVVLGAHHYTDHPVPPRHSMEELQDPRFQYADSHHVDRVSLHDGAFFEDQPLCTILSCWMRRLSS